MIKRFSFRLDQVLRHRASIRDLKEREFAEVEAQLLREEQILGDLKRMQNEMLDSLAKIQASAFETLERELYAQYLGWLSSEIEREKQAISDIRLLLEEKRKDLVRALQDHRVVERLKDHQFESYNKDLERENQGVLDEIASASHARGVRVLGAGGNA
jgi:flagellar FliJ protein